MILCTIDELEPGLVTAASILHPDRPDMELLAPNQTLTPQIIKRLADMGIPHVWTKHELTNDLPNVTGESLTLAQRQIYNDLKSVFKGSSSRTVTAAHIANFKQSIMSLVCDVIAHKEIAGLSARLRTSDGPLFSHSASVAYLCIVLGLELENYIIAERSRLNVKDARDFTGLGLAGMLHDIGKITGDRELAATHELDADLPNEYAIDENEDTTPEGYRDHPRIGYDMLEHARVPPATRQAVLMHHRRWDGSGWPTVQRSPDKPQPQGRALHVFSRIVAAANTLDTLMLRIGHAKPPALALHEFASPRFHGYFDPVVVRATLRAVPPFTIGSRVTLSDDTTAVVTAPNRDTPLLPVVRPLVKDGDTHMIDLAIDPQQRHVTRAANTDVSHVRYHVPEPRDPNTAQAA